MMDSNCDSHEHQGPWPTGCQERELTAAAAMFRVLGDSARLRLIELLSHGERCVTEIAAHTGDEISTVSQRLKVLRAENLIARRRQGKHMYYSLADEHVLDMVRTALDHASHSHGPADLED